MGNCHASEAATVLIQRPGNKIERLYFSISAQEVMNSNPGHYVALVVTTTTPPSLAAKPSDNGGPVKQLKLLRPSDSLQIGQVYRLISFEDVLKEFNGKKCVKLGKLLKEKKGCDKRPKHESGADHVAIQKDGDEDEQAETYSSSAESYMSIRIMNKQQWRPALQSISEIRTST
ncbi:hypothetical protein QQ045_028106 [Rhodiola kirilowii]